MTVARGSLNPFNRVFLLLLAPVVSLLFIAIDNRPFLYESLSRGQPIGRDFAAFWTASVMLWRGQATLLFDPATYQQALNDVIGLQLGFLPFPYPPHSLMFVAPLALFPYLLALSVWLAATFCFVLAVLWRRVDQHWTMVFGLLLSPAAAVNISTGQNGFLSAALLCGGLLLLERRPLLAGLLIGLLSYKPQLGVLLPFLLIAAGHWRAFGAAAATVIFMIVGSVILLGPEAWTLYLSKAGPLQLEVAQFGSGRFQFMVPTYFMSARLLGLPLWQAWMLQGISAALVAAAALWAFRQPAPHALKAALAMVAVVLISPYVLTYDLMIVAVAILVAGQCFVPDWRECLVFALAWILPVITWPSQLPAGPLVLTLLFLLLLRRLAKSRDGQSTWRTKIS